MRAKNKGAKSAARRAATPVDPAEESLPSLEPLLALAADYYWEQDDEHRFTVWRALRADAPILPEAAEWLGRTSAELCAAPADDPDHWARHAANLAAREPFREVVHALPGRSGLRHLTLSGTAAYDARRRFRGYRGVARDIGALAGLERLLALEGAVARALAEADSVATALPMLLERTCETGNFAAGAYFTLDERTRVLHREAHHERAGAPVPSTLTDGGAAPEWLGPDPVFSAAVAAGESAASATLLVPVAAGAATIGVLEFSVRAPSAPDAALVRVLRSLAAQLAHLHARAAALEQLRESESRFASTMALAAIGISHVDDRGRFLYANPQLCAVLGYSEPELLALTVKDISHPDDVNVTDGPSQQLREGKIASFKAEKRYLRKDGSAIWVGLTIAAKRDRAGRKLYDVSIVEDISVRKEAEQCVKYLASHDTLTELPNRATFAQLLAQSIEAARRHARRIAVLFIDLDRFKVVNDTLGHEAGDALLREAAARLRAAVRATDVVARLGGDEFVVLLHDVRHTEAAARVANNILSSLRAPFAIRGNECAISASIGICLHPEGAQEDQAVLRNADMAMYLAKQSGKNGFRFFVDELRVAAAERARVDGWLREAWERGDYRLEYSAVVAEVRGSVVGFAARVHFTHEELARVPAEMLASVMAEAGLGAPLNDWALRTACAAAAGWQRPGVEPVTIAVPTVTAQLRDPAFAARVRAELAAAGVDAGCLELYLEEETLLAGEPGIAQTLAALDALGVSIGLDAFGSGKASFADLRRHPLRALRLHPSRVAGVAADADRQQYVEGVLALARALRLSVVAAGVSTEADAAHLTAAGCTALQGPFAAHALTADECLALLASRGTR
jgi:diguanylate cyclase (GGDEF)-like protein/PAS domain S-box-containing protein